MGQSKFNVDRRAFGRRNSCIHATLLVPARGPIPCVVRNFSPSGAMIEPSASFDPPFRIKVRLCSGGREIDCEVRYSRGRQIGVSFVGDGAAAELARVLGAVIKARRPRPLLEALSLPRISGTELRRVIFRQKPV